MEERLSALFEERIGGRVSEREKEIESLQYNIAELRATTLSSTP